jgi:AraC-like DNA-binding protein
MNLWLDRQPSPSGSVEAGVHTPGLMRRHSDRILPVHELIVVQSGTLPIAEGNQRFAVRQGHWIVLLAGRRHYGYQDLDQQTWFYWVCFGARDADLMLPALTRGQQGGPLNRPDRLRLLFENLLEDQLTAILTPLAARGYLQLMLAEIQLEPSEPMPPGAATSVARRAASFIGDHLTESDLGTARIADSLACSPDYLGRVFRETFHETLTGHVHRRRIDRARMLFRSTDLPTERVAVDVGFTDARYFRRIFKRHVGLTPKEFQRLYPAPGTARCLGPLRV